VNIGSILIYNMSTRRVKTIYELLAWDDERSNRKQKLEDKQIKKPIKENSKKTIKTSENPVEKHKECLKKPKETSEKPVEKKHDECLKKPEAKVKETNTENRSKKPQGKLEEAMLTNTQLKNRLAETNAAIKKVKEAQLLIMQWAQKQEWEFPQNIRELLPKNKKFMREAAFERVPHGKSPAEYTFNLLYFFSLTKSEQEELGAKVFEHEKDARPEEFAALEYVTKEVNDFLFYFPDESVKMSAEYGYLSSMVPKHSTDPRSEWVILKKLALGFFPVYTRVTVKRAVERSYTWGNLNQTDNKAAIKYNLIAERSDDYHGTCRYQIGTNYDSKTGSFTLKDQTYKWEIKNYGIVWYQGLFKVSNLVMDNNPPYKEGMEGIVEIHWTGDCIYDTSED